MNSQTWFNGAMHRLGLFIVAPALLLASCAVGVPSDANDVRFTPERPLQIDWVRTVAGYEISGSGRQIDLGELSLLQEAFEIMPDPVLELAQPDALFRIPRGEQVSSLASAFTKGSDIYITDHTFEVAQTPLIMKSILAHELVHVAQFQALVVELEASGAIPTDDAMEGSALVRDFAEAVGWQADDSGDTVVWTLSFSRGTTEYGRSSPVEDMADSLAMIVTGAEDTISASRVTWITDWLDTSLATLDRGGLWVHETGERVTSEVDLFNSVLVQTNGIVDPVPTYYAWDEDGSSIERLTNLVRQRLRAYGWAGTLTPIVDPAVPRVGGVFSIGARTMWVEVWDFPHGQHVTGGPDGPLVAYVVSR